MKLVYTTIFAALIAACSTHPLRCSGLLRPINKPVVSDSPVTGHAEPRP
jgi:hypothetical protein